MSKWLMKMLFSTTIYSMEAKSVTSFNQFTFFHADINQSKVEDSFQLASDWIKSVRKNVNKWRAVTRQKKVPHKPPPSNLVTIKNWEAQMVAGKLGCVHVLSPSPWREGVTVHSATGYQQEGSC